MTGPLAFASSVRDVKDSVQAATTAINAACKIHHPLEVIVCDDQSDLNQSTQPGRRAGRPPRTQCKLAPSAPAPAAQTPRVCLAQTASTLTATTMAN
jgi:hypothetical protein